MRRIAVIVGAVLLAFAAFPATSGAAPGRRSCQVSCRHGSQACVSAFGDMAAAALAGDCAALASRAARRSCRHDVRATRRAGRRACHVAARDCRVCCRGDVTACEVSVCGNGLVEAGEACDGAGSGGCPGACISTCACAAATTSTTSTTIAGPRCGDGVLGPEEDCDGASDEACPGRCLPTCRCTICGDDVADVPHEACDGTDAGACPDACSSYSCQCLSSTTDACEAPRRLSVPGTDHQSVVAATSAAEDPLLACASFVPRQQWHSVWYVVTAPGTGRLRADTAGSNYDTVLAAFTGSCGSPTGIACDDDSAIGRASRVDFPVTTGAEYLLEVTSYDQDSGEVAMAVDFKPCGDGVLDPGEECDPATAANSCPGFCGPTCRCLAAPYDECAAAPVATSLPLRVRAAADRGTAAASDPSVTGCQGNLRPPTIWYRFRAPMDGRIAIDTSGSNYDTVVAAFAGSCQALTAIDCDDDSGEEEASWLVLTVTAGVEYAVIVQPVFWQQARELQLSIAYLDPNGD